MDKNCWNGFCCHDCNFFYQLFIFVLKFKVLFFFFLNGAVVYFYCQFKTGSFEILREAAKALHENCGYIQFKQRNRIDWPVKMGYILYGVHH